MKPLDLTFSLQETERNKLNTNKYRMWDIYKHNWADQKFSFEKTEKGIGGVGGGELSQMKVTI